MNKTKKCCACKNDLSLDMFSKNKHSPDGLQTICKKCVKIYNQLHKEYNKKHFRKYYLANREEVLKKKNEYKRNNKVMINEKQKKYVKDNPDINKEWHEKNIKHVKEYRQNYYQRSKKRINKAARERRANDALYKLSSNIRKSVTKNFGLNGYSKNLKTCEILGCTFEEFKTYIESKFEPWMNWNNYGNWNGIPETINIAWDIDHIIPLCTAKSVEDIIRLNHHTNLQPLCSYTNRHIKWKKSA
jgi:hypothetical protein